MVKANEWLWNKYMNDYGIKIWGNDNFIINDGKLCLNNQKKTEIYKIVKQITENSKNNDPIILRFPHLIKKQLHLLYQTFEKSKKTQDYNGNFYAVFPLKVNPFEQVVSSISKLAATYNYGMEAGSKAELILAMAHAPIGSPITINGFKDEAMISLAFIAKQMGHHICLIIEGIDELNAIVKIANDDKLTIPSIGIRIRLHSTGSGKWEKSGGYHAKFGLNSTEILLAINILAENKLLDKFTMIHFHIGSQNQDILPIKKALREAANIYAELKKMGANKLKAINIGGGLPVEYSQNKGHSKINYSLTEFANDVCFLIGETLNAKNVEHPDIFTESGRFIIASHAILISPVLELFSHDYKKQELQLKPENPPLINELKDLLDDLNHKNCIEYLHDALSHIESILTLFDLGYIDLHDRSNTEILVHQIIKKTLILTQTQQTSELMQLQEKLQERYLVNCSLFQSIPDYWGIKQRFPLMPIHHLNKNPTHPASIWDITCDSDGEIPFSSDNPLYLHDIDLEQDDYYLGFFNVGAYQEILGMKHNLFAHPYQAIIELNDEGYSIKKVDTAINIQQTHAELGYNNQEIMDSIKKALLTSKLSDPQSQNVALDKLQKFMQQSSYLT